MEIEIQHRSGPADDETKFAVRLQSLDTHTHGELTRLSQDQQRAVTHELAKVADTIAHIVRGRGQSVI